MVIGFDRGEGLVIRFAASLDEARGGMFTNLGTSDLEGFCSVMALVAADCEMEDGAGVGDAMAALASRLLA